MVTKEIRNVLSAFLILLLIIGSSKMIAGFQGANATPDTGAPTQAVPMSQDELKGLVAPIALYPDNLVAEVLAAATFPDQVAIADYWLQQHKNLTGSALVQAVDKQSWDASVKGLTQFPSVLNNMAKSLSWTSQLGEAYHNQKSEVMSAIQTLRAQAKAAGNLKSTSQMTVVQKTPQTIVIEPSNPDVVYVPQYNPAVIYGYPYVTPGYSAGDVAAASAISFGAGVALGAWAGGGWGWNSWGCNWGGGSVTYNRNNFYGNAAWHGGYAGGYHPYGFDGGYHPYGGYHPGETNAFNRNEFNRNVSGNTVNVNKAGVQNFNKSTMQNFSANRSSNAFGGNHFSDANSWAHHDNWGGRSTAFSGLGSHAGGFGGWSSRADSARGWGSMRAGGFGGFHGFGGFGGFHGGGFHGRRR